MHRMTIGQVLALFDGMVRYVKLTNPWGSGDEDDHSSSRHGSGGAVRGEHIGADDPGALSVLGPVVVPNVQVLPKSAAPDDVRELIERLEGR